MTITPTAKDIDLARRVALNPSTPPELLEELANNSDAVIRKNVTANPNTPTEVLLELGAEFPEQLLNNPIFSLLLLENPNLINEIPLPTLRSILKLEQVPEAFRERELELFEWLRTLREPSNYVGLVAISPDGQTLISSSGKQSIKIRNLHTGEELRTLEIDATLPRNGYYMSPCAISPDSKNIAIWADNRKTIKLWNLHTGELICTLKGNKYGFTDIVFSNDGKTIATIGGGTLKLWNLQTGEELRTIDEEDSELFISCLAISPNEQTLACGYCYFSDSHRYRENGYIKLWHLPTGELQYTLEEDSHTVTCLTFSPDGQRLASGSYKGRTRGGVEETIKIWNVQTGELQRRILSGHSKSVKHIAFSPDGQTLISCAQYSSYRAEETLKLWNLHTGELLRSLESPFGEVYSMTLSPDGQTLLACCLGETTKCWNLHTGKLENCRSWGAGAATSIAISSDGQTLASGNENGTIQLWNLHTGEELRSFVRHLGSVICVAISPDGKLLASGSEDRTIKLWNLHTGEFERSLEGHLGKITSLAISPDGRWLASGSEDRTIKLWNLHTGKQLHSVKWRNQDWGHLYSVAFSPDEQTLACGGSHSIMLWTLYTGELYTLKKEAPITPRNSDSLAISPDSQILASCGDEYTIKLWNLQTKEHISTLKKADSGLIPCFQLVAFSPDGKTLATGSFSEDERIIFWNLRTTSIKHVLKARYASGGFSHILRDLVFSPDGQTLVSCSLNGDIQVWGIP